MIYGVGVDIVSISRFRSMSKDRQNKLASRILDDSELDLYNKSTDSGKLLAKHWCVKEAVAKTFGTGIRNDVVWKNIVLRNTDLGQPVINFKNSLADCKKQCLVSLSHESDMLVSYAILTHD